MNPTARREIRNCVIDRHDVDKYCKTVQPLPDDLRSAVVKHVVNKTKFVDLAKSTGISAHRIAAAVNNVKFDKLCRNAREARQKMIDALPPEERNNPRLKF